MKQYLLPLAALLSVPSLHAQTIISANFTGSGATVSTEDTAGVIAASNWNNGSGSPEVTLSNLTFDDGTNSGATVQLLQPNSGSSNQATTISSGTDGNYDMFNGGLRVPFSGNSRVLNLSFTNLPTTGDWANGYDVYVYFSVDDNVGVPGDPGALNGATDGTTSYYVDLDSSVNYSGTYVIADSTSSGSPSSTGNYFLWSGFSGASSPTFAFSDGPNYVITGAQVVAVPEPGLAAMLAGLLAGLVVLRRRLKR